jgi:integrase/recombinase XerD
MLRQEWSIVKTYLEPQEIKLLEEAATCLRDRLLIRFLFHLGCRVSEALNVRAKDVDIRQSTVTIVHLKRQFRLSCQSCGARLGQSHKFCPACGKEVVSTLSEERERRRMRTLPIDQETVEMLADYVRRGGSVLRKGDNLIFGINRHRAWQIIRECAEKAKLPKLINPETGKIHNVSPHKLRDAFAVHAVKTDDSGDGLRLLQEHLGHASFDTTARYRKVGGTEHRDWYGKLWEEENH